MRFFKNNTRVGIVALGLVLTVASCGGAKIDDKSAIMAIWQLHSIMVNGMEIGDGKGFLDFKQDGSVVSRTGPGLYDQGQYTLDPDAKTLTLSQDTTKLVYEYSLTMDSLTMRSNESGRTLILRGHRVDKLPVDPENDVFKP